MTLVTIFSLFGEDCKLGFLEKSYDQSFDNITLICLLCFINEIVCVSIVQDDYFLGFYFWLDLVSTISLVSDIEFIWQQITGTQDEL